MRIHSMKQLNHELDHYRSYMTPAHRKEARILVNELLRNGMEVDIDFYHKY